MIKSSGIFRFSLFIHKLLNNPCFLSKFIDFGPKLVFKDFPANFFENLFDRAINPTLADSICVKSKGVSDPGPKKASDLLVPAKLFLQKDDDSHVSKMFYPLNLDKCFLFLKV